MNKVWARVRAVVMFAVAFGIIATVAGGTVQARQPYIRVYGNDVIAGGGYGSCTSDPDDDVRGFGAFIGPAGHDTYVGSGAELGVFTPGAIEGFLPGSVTTSLRSALWELSFANDDAAKRTPPFGFGGGFLPTQCVDDFPDASGFTALSPTDDPLDINSLPSGNYVYSASDRFHFTTSAIDNSKRITIVIDEDPSNPLAGGDLTISGNITYANTTWATPADIPSLTVYVKGDIKIDHSVETITGVYFGGGNGDGNIYTCTDQDTRLEPGPDPLPPSGNEVDGITSFATFCNDRTLTVYGALVGNETFFYRTLHDVSDGTVGESHGSSSRAAESIIFSPEVYIPHTSSSGPITITPGQIDAIRSLPPAF